MLPFLRRIGVFCGLVSPIPNKVADALSRAFPVLDERGIAYLYRQGVVRTFVSHLLVSEMDDPTPRIALLVDGAMTVERPLVEEIGVAAGIVWNELTWASLGRIVGGRLHAGDHGATVIEWRGNRLRSMATDHPRIYGALTEAVMRWAGLRQTLQLEKARHVPPATLWRESSLTFDELIKRDKALRTTNGAAVAARTAA